MRTLIFTFAMLLTIAQSANAKPDGSQCSDVLAEHLTNKQFEYNYSNSKYLYAEKYSSMEWKDFKEEAEAGVTIPIKGIPIGGKVSRNQFEKWKKEVKRSVNIADIQQNMHTLMLSSANAATISAWETCMIQRRNDGVFGYLESVANEVFQLKIYGRPSVFGQKPPKVVGSYFLDNAEIVNGDRYLGDNENIDTQRIITLRRLSKDKAVIFNMNTTSGPIEAFLPKVSVVPEWPVNLIVKHRLVFNDNYGAGVWRDITSPPKAAFPINHVAGDNSRGVIISGGENSRSLWYLDNYGTGVWRQIIDAPFEVLGLTGNNSKGPLIFGGRDSRSVAYLSNYGSQAWVVIAAPAPFEIKGISGDNARGAIIFGGAGDREVYHLRNYGKPVWTKVATAPFGIKGIAGTNSKGPIIYGGPQSRKVAYMNNYKNNKWATLPQAPEKIDFLGGNNERGPIVLNAETDRFYYLNSYANPTWTALSLPSPGAAMASGDNGRGLIVGFEQ